MRSAGYNGRTKNHGGTRGGFERQGLRNPVSTNRGAGARKKWSRDPFDRLIVAHAKAGDAALITKDENIAATTPEPSGRLQRPRNLPQLSKPVKLHQIGGSALPMAGLPQIRRCRPRADDSTCKYMAYTSPVIVISIQ